MSTEGLFQVKGRDKDSFDRTKGHFHRPSGSAKTSISVQKFNENDNDDDDNNSETVYEESADERFMFSATSQQQKQQRHSSTPRKDKEKSPPTRKTSRRNRKELKKRRSPGASAGGRGPFSAKSKSTGRQNQHYDDEDEEQTMDSAEEEAADEYEMEDRGENTRKKMTSGSLLMLDEANGEDTTFLLEQGLKDRNLFNITTYKLPTKRSQEEQEEYDKLIYVPGTNPVSLEEKLFHYKIPRHPEDEGLYSENFIPITTRNQNRLEQRILKENGFGWFGQDGQIHSFSNPKRGYGIRIFYDEVEEEEFKRKLTFVPAKLDPFQLFQLDSTQTYEIIIDISSITFKHHALFSKEQVLASRLQLKFIEYLKRVEFGTTERLKNKLKALREVLNYTKSLENILREKIENGIQLSNEEETQFIQIEDRIMKYREEMKVIRMERDQSLWNDKVALLSTLDAWKSLKALRQHQEYMSTDLKLKILTSQGDLETDREQWTTELNQELEDMKEEVEIEYELNYREYQKQLKAWQRKRRRGQVNERGDTDEVVEEDYERPIEPVKHDLKKLRGEISKRFRQLNRLPGEPKVTLQLTTNLITPTNELPKGSEKEEARRIAVENTKLKLRIIFNGKEVYRTKSKDLKPDFTTFFGLSIPIEINEWPKSLQISIWEKSKLGRHFDGNIDLSFPNSKTSIDEAQSEKLEFKSDGIIKLTNNDGVGAGVLFQILGNEVQGIPTSGFGVVKIGWSKDENGHLLCPQQVDDITGYESKRTASQELLEKDTQLDPNDPNNARWLNQKLESERQIGDTTTETVAKTRKQRLLKKDGFALDDLMEEFDFCSMDDINNSLRFRLLQLRDEDVPEFRNLRMIAAYDEDIPVNIFKSVGYHMDPHQEAFAFQETDTNGNGEIDFSNRLEKIRQIRMNVLKRFESSSKQLTFEDLVIEEQIPDIGTLGLNLMSLFQPRRALRPERKERKKLHIGTSLLDTSVSLIVNIVRATNLPMKRIENPSLETLTTEAITGVSYFKKDITSGTLNISTVKPFVEVCFKRTHTRTITAMGSNPIWNQELQLPLTTNNYSQLNQIEDDIYILIYDEVEIDILEDDRRRNTDIHQRLEKRWLGSVTIPFSTLYLNGRIEGTFKINSPPVLLGYETQIPAGFPGTPLGGHTFPDSKKNTDVTTMRNQKQAFITFFITLQPSIIPSSICKKISSSGESMEILNHIEAWQSKIIQKFPERKLKALVMNSSGESFLATRYLDKIQPPESLATDDEDVDILEIMEDLGHYVALFPSLRSTVEANDLNFWLTSDVFVGTPGGGIDDHAVLLCCYFMYLEIPCWLVYGNAVLDGPTTFVLTSFKNIKKDDTRLKTMKNETFIWNPYNGEYFNVNGSFCPLQNVWCIIGKQNIWGNMSPYDLPQHLDWNFEKSAQWLPLFSKPIPENKLPSLQSPDIIRYVPVDKPAVSRLTQHIERNLKEAFMIWRKTSRTIWNRHCSSILRRILPNLEQRKGKFGPMEIQNPAESNPLLFTPDSSLTDDPFTELKEILASYQITGFPLQQPFLNMETLTETVYATSLHSIDTPNVEFALAVYVHGYPANVFSVWIYLAALYKKK